MKSLRGRRISPSGRWFGIACVLTIAGGLIWFVISPSASSHIPLLDGQTFSTRDLARMASALHEADLVEAFVQDRQLFVPLDEHEAYLVALESADVLPAELDAELAQAVRSENPFLSRVQIEKQQQYGEWKKLERIISEMDDIEAASVQCAETKRETFPPRIERQAFVAVRAANKRHLDLAQVEAIREMTGGYLALRREEVTVSDLNAFRTFSGSLMGDANSAEDYAHTATKQALEDEYQAKLSQHLVRYPGAVVTVNVELVPIPTAATLERESVTNRCQPIVTASIDLPRSCLDRILQARRPAGSNGEPASAALEDEQLVLQSIQAAVTPLLPALPAGCDPRCQVTVTASADVPQLATSEPSVKPWLPARTSWAIAAGIALLVLSGLSSLGWLRKHRAPRRGESPVETVDPPRTANSNPLPSEPGPLEQLAAAQATETDERLIEAVRQDPDAAAELLKKWLGRAA